MVDVIALTAGLATSGDSNSKTALVVPAITLRICASVKAPIAQDSVKFFKTDALENLACD
jgi:hypothetical protein